MARVVHLTNRHDEIQIGVPVREFFAIRFLMMDKLDDIDDLVGKYTRWVHIHLVDLLGEEGRLPPAYEHSLRVPLPIVDSWRRGQIRPDMLPIEAVLDENGPIRDSVWCLTLDNKGLTGVQRHPERQTPFSQSRNNTTNTFAVLNLEEAIPIWLRFKVTLSLQPPLSRCTTC